MSVLRDALAFFRGCRVANDIESCGPRSLLQDLIDEAALSRVPYTAVLKQRLKDVGINASRGDDGAWEFTVATFHNPGAHQASMSDRLKAVAPPMASGPTCNVRSVIFEHPESRMLVQALSVTGASGIFEAVCAARHWAG